MGLKSEFKPVCKKIWKAFNSWRKRGMWFRVTVLLIIGFSMNLERLYTTNHVPLINELVLIACKAIRYRSEPKVISAHLRYLHVQKSRQLQNQLRAKVKDGSLRLNQNELKLLNENTLNANYNKLFVLAKRAIIIPSDVTLSQTKRAMLDKSCKLTAERFDPEWADVKKMVFAQPPLSMKGLRQNLWWFCHSLLAVLPLPVIPALPWFILCFTLGFWGAQSKYLAKWILATTLAVAITLAWIYATNFGGTVWRFMIYYWRMVGVSVFFSIWAIVASILGKRLYNYTSKHHKEMEVFIFLLLVVCILLLMPITFFKAYYTGWYYWGLPGNCLFFRNSNFAPYFVTVGIGVLCYTWFLIHKNYVEQLRRFQWLTTIKYLLIILFALKLVYMWHPILSKYFKF